MACRHIDLVGELVREADSEEAGRHAGDATFPPGHQGKPRGVEIEAPQFLKHRVRTRAAEHGDGLLHGHVGKIDVEIGPFGPEPLLEPSHHALGAARGGHASHLALK